MTPFKIKITYTTGNSLSQKSTTDDLELTWENLDNAKDNLNRIKEHYGMYREINTYNYYGKEVEILNRYSNKDWFVNKSQLYCISGDYAVDEADKHKIKENDLEYRIDIHTAKQHLRLKTDNGNYMQLSAFWIGYFEDLEYAEVVINDENLKIEF